MPAEGVDLGLDEPVVVAVDLPGREGTVDQNPKLT